MILRKSRTSLLTLMGAQVGGALLVHPGTAAAAVEGNDYPHKNDSTSETDSWGFYKRQCTSFVAWRMNDQEDVRFENNMDGGHWGNASEWDENARELGYDVDDRPAIGSVAQWDRGHVAYVAEVNDGTVTVEEYNWDDPYAYSTREIPVSAVEDFIHIED